MHHAHVAGKLRIECLITLSRQFVNNFGSSNIPMHLKLRTLVSATPKFAMMDLSRTLLSRSPVRYLLYAALHEPIKYLPTRDSISETKLSVRSVVVIFNPTGAGVRY